ncbi:response regulator [Fodinicola feengrottensis]|uniref:response regulator n=1 Tax=Fodinicola feengrottensis TaxID=435914 RepID=UPI0036F410A9
MPGFSVLGTAHSATEARGRIAELTPDLLLLDLHLPDDSALRLLAEIEIDTMVLTAAAESTTVRAALRAGALNYLLKPFTAAQLGTRLTAYARYQALLQGSQTLRQNDIDRAVRALHDNDRSSTAKGQSPVTARLVTDALRRAGRPRSAIEIATELGIARATAQRYLGALAESGEARIGASACGTAPPAGPNTNTAGWARRSNWPTRPPTAPLSRIWQAGQKVHPALADRVRPDDRHLAGVPGTVGGGRPQRHESAARVGNGCGPGFRAVRIHRRRLPRFPVIGGKLNGHTGDGIRRHLLVHHDRNTESGTCRRGPVVIGFRGEPRREQRQRVPVRTSDLLRPESQFAADRSGQCAKRLALRHDHPVRSVGRRRVIIDISRPVGDFHSVLVENGACATCEENPAITLVAPGEHRRLGNQVVRELPTAQRRIRPVREETRSESWRVGHVGEVTGHDRTRFAQERRDRLPVGCVELGQQSPALRPWTQVFGLHARFRGRGPGRELERNDPIRQREDRGPQRLAGEHRRQHLLSHSGKPGFLGMQQNPGRHPARGQLRQVVRVRRVDEIAGRAGIRPVTGHHLAVKRGRGSCPDRAGQQVSRILGTESGAGHRPTGRIERAIGPDAHALRTGLVHRDVGWLGLARVHHHRQVVVDGEVRRYQVNRAAIGLERQDLGRILALGQPDTRGAILIAVGGETGDILAVRHESE